MVFINEEAKKMRNYFIVLAFVIGFLLGFLLPMLDLEVVLPAFMGLLGVIVGGVISSLPKMIELFEKKSLDTRRKKYIHSMLTNNKFKWRKLSTISRVIGADEDETKRLLIMMGARGSEKKDHENMWGLIEINPLPENEDN